MNNAIENLREAHTFALSNRPKIGGFPFLAEVLRRAGVTRNIWQLPSCQSIYLTKFGAVSSPGTPLSNETSEISPFNRESLIKALRKDQASGC